MCIAIVKLPDASIPVEALQSSWIANPDGAGFAYAKDGAVVIEKGFMTLKAFMEAYTVAAEANKASTFLVHFRIRSMGAKGAEHTHPYKYELGAMIHNGTIDGTGAKWDKGESDTALFLNKYKDKLTLEVLTAHQEDIEKALSYNKLAFLFNDGKHFIVNAKSGVWDNGVWYSNSSYIPRKTTPIALLDHDDLWDYKQ